jgi:hypothetical protein
MPGKIKENKNGTMAQNLRKIKNFFSNLKNAVAKIAGQNEGNGVYR